MHFVFFYISNEFEYFLSFNYSFLDSEGLLGTHMDALDPFIS